ncbi:uncharacterized protein LOC143282864 [Babylonia areolata]|uniref:uncharacterized protein LOC143282864 n=1 Tax=Babylonia areolata TaxID=304850 RepID=UPI003FCFFB9C
MCTLRSWTAPFVVSVWCLTVATGTPHHGYYGLSDSPLTWPQYQRQWLAAGSTLTGDGRANQTYQNKQRCSVGGPLESEVVQWEGQHAAAADDVGGDDDEDGDGDGLPSALTQNTSLWLPALSVASLVWKHVSGERPFFQSKCYRAGELPRDLSKYESYGPSSCFQNIAQTPFQEGSVMVLKGEECYCLPPDKLKNLLQPVNETCPNKCLEENQMCGGDGKLYSVYEDLPSVKLGQEKLRTGTCFTGRFRDQGNLVITPTSCNDNSTVICVRNGFTPEANEGGYTNYRKGKIHCSADGIDSSLPAHNPDGNTGLKQFFKKLYRMLKHVPIQNLHSVSFWLSLEFKTTYSWLKQDGSEGREQLTGDKSREGAECPALTRNASHVFLENRPCNTPLHYLIDCRKQDLKGSKPKTFTEADVELATAVGMTGVTCLVIFSLVALLLFVLKKSGRLRIRQKPSFHSTGDWDQPEDSVAARAHREAHLADLQARLAQTRGRQLKPLTPAALSSSSSSSTTTAPRRVGPRPSSAEYTQPKPLRGSDYAEVIPLVQNDAATIPLCNDHNHKDGDELAVKVVVLTRSPSAARRQIDASSSQGADTHEDARIYSEPVRETEKEDHAAEAANTNTTAHKKGTTASAGPVLAGQSTCAGLRAGVSVPPSTLPKPPRPGDYEEVEDVVNMLPTSSAESASPQAELPPPQGDCTDGAGSATCPVPRAAPSLEEEGPVTVSSEQEEAERPTCSAPHVVAANGSGGEGDHPGRCVGSGGEEGKQSGVPHVVCPAGDVYAQPMNKGVVVVSLKNLHRNTKP